MLKNNKGIPDKPGVYLFKSAGGRVLYVGKALNLRKRTAQYFQKGGHPLLAHLLQRAATLDCVVTRDETDALLLEYNLVQQYQPPFNIRLKDDKTYPFIEITSGNPYPGVFYARRTPPTSFALGPLATPRKAKELIDLLARIFKIRQCTNAVFNQGVPCLYFHIDRCSAPCAGRIPAEVYRQRAAEAVDLLKGEKGLLLRRLEIRMRQLAGELKFEEAQQVKEDISLIRGFTPESYIASGQKSDYDVIAAASQDHETQIVFFSVLNGRVSRTEYFSLQTVSSRADDVLKEFILRFYRAGPLPAEIVVSFPPADAAELEGLFLRLTGHRVRFRVPQRGSKKKLLDLAAENLQWLVTRDCYAGLARRLQKRLQLRRLPERIEGYDISHISESERVGAMVAFERGQPQPHRYRSYLIRRAAAGDTEALKEVLSRRLRAAAPHADLLLIDGGKPQLAAARQVKEELGVAVDLVALAKGEERLYLENGGSLVLAPGTVERHLLQQIRDEAHRRALSHHRRRREKLD